MPEPRYFEDKPIQKQVPDYLKPETTTDRSQKHEKDRATASGKRRTPGSGNRPGRPGDLSGNTDLSELKTTKKTDTRIQLSWLRKISHEALSLGRQPVLELRFESLTPPTPKDWVLLPAAYYDELREKAE